MIWPVNNPDLNPTENYWWNIFKMIHEKVLLTKELLTTIWERWNHFDKESMPERIKTVIKDWRDN